MLSALATLLPLAIPSPPSQDCQLDLPSPPGDVRNLGGHVAAGGDVIVASETFQADLHVWRRGASGVYAVEASLDFPFGAEDVSTDGDTIAVTTTGSALEVWSYEASSGWTQAPQVAPAPGFTGFRSPVVVSGDLLLVRGQNAEVWVYRQDSVTGIWEYTAAVVPEVAPDMSFGTGIAYAEGRLAVTARSTFPNQAIEIFRETPQGAFVYDGRLPEVDKAERFDLQGDRILVAQGPFAQIWRQIGPGSWNLEETLHAPEGQLIGAVALANNWALTGVIGSGSVTAHPTQVFRRRPGSSRWVHRGDLAPLGGIDHPLSEYASELEVVGDQVIAGERKYSVGANPFGITEGRVALLDLGCVSPPPVVHWLLADLQPSLLAAWPSAFTPLTLTTAETIPVGAPRGLRNPQVFAAASYDLNVTGLPCFATYSTEICSFFAYSLRDGVSGDASDAWPIDPLFGFPQFFASQPGPTVMASANSSQLSVNFGIATGDAPDFTIEPTGAPLELEIAAASYNCLDTGGIWVQHPPDVVAYSSCSFDELPSTITNLDLTLSVAAELAFDLEPLPLGTQSPICDGSSNSTGVGARLVAEGSASIVDDALFLTVSDVPPTSSGFILLSADPAQPPFVTLGQGELCLGIPMANLTTTPSKADAYGQVATRVPVGALPGGFVVSPGQSLYLQFVYRDKNPGPTTNTSSALRVLFQ